MTIESTLSLINAISLIAASAVPFYLVFKAKSRPLQVFSVLLGIFAFSHGAYHYLSEFVVGYIARAVLDTLSVGVLIIFAIYYSVRGGMI